MKRRLARSRGRARPPPGRRAPVRINGAVRDFLAQHDRRISDRLQVVAVALHIRATRNSVGDRY